MSNPFQFILHMYWQDTNNNIVGARERETKVKETTSETQGQASVSCTCYRNVSIRFEISHLQRDKAISGAVKGGPGRAGFYRIFNSAFI